MPPLDMATMAGNDAAVLVDPDRHQKSKCRDTVANLRGSKAYQSRLAMLWVSWTCGCNA
jgi:hypothetical protein